MDFYPTAEQLRVARFVLKGDDRVRWIRALVSRSSVVKRKRRWFTAVTRAFCCRWCLRNKGSVNDYAVHNFADPSIKYNAPRLTTSSFHLVSIESWILRAYNWSGYNPRNRKGWIQLKLQRNRVIRDYIPELQEHVLRITMWFFYMHRISSKCQCTHNLIHWVHCVPHKNRNLS